MCPAYINPLLTIKKLLDDQKNVNTDWIYDNIKELLKIFCNCDCGSLVMLMKEFLSFKHS